MQMLSTFLLFLFHLLSYAQQRQYTIGKDKYLIDNSSSSKHKNILY